jgi:2-hydroxylaminobenzoate mutase
MPTRDDVLEALRPVIDAIAALPHEAPDAAQARLTRDLPLDGPVLRRVRDVLRAAVAAGTVCDRANGSVRFSRLLRADAGRGYSVDLVHMAGTGGAHTHPAGEIDLCFAIDAGARFDGQGEGWTVYAPNSWHVPTVDGGAMDIVYFLPPVAIEFGERPVHASPVGLQATR